MSRKKHSSGKRTPATVPQRNAPALRRSSVAVLSSLFSKAGGLSSLLAQDGYSNAAAFLGDDSPLLSAGTFRRSFLTSRTELLTTTYRESWLAKRIIDMPSEDMTHTWYTLSTRLPEEDLKALRRLEARHSVRQELKTRGEPLGYWSKLQDDNPLT